jgi:hypothetical protein
MSTGESERYRQVAADAVTAALRLARSDMPDASAARMLLLIVGQAAAYLGRLGVNSQDVLTITWAITNMGAAKRPRIGKTTKIFLSAAEPTSKLMFR